VSEACEPENPEVLVDPAQVDFGTAKMGESVERAVTFTNHTGGVATLNCTVQGGVFHADCPATLTEGEIRTVALTFSSPATSSATTYSGKLTVDYSSAAATGTAVVMLSGSSVGKALALVAQPDSLGFGAVKVGKSKTKSVSIVLTGDGSLVPDTVEIPGGPFEVVDDGCSKHQLASTSVNSCSVGIRFKPMETGDHEGTLTVSAKAVTVQVALSGTGDPVCTDACVGDERQCWGQGQVRICVQSGDCRTWKTESCGGGEICVSPGECVSCGGSGQPCCESGCNSGLSCTSGKCVQSTPCSTSFTWSAGIKASGQGIGAVEVTWNPAPDKLEPCVDHYAVLRFLGGPPPPGGYSLSCGPSTETSCLVGETSGTSLVDDGLPPGKHFFWGLYPVKPDGKLGPIQGFAGATVPN
jgi:hypothetical protein